MGSSRCSTVCRQPLGEYLPCKSATNSKWFREFLLKNNSCLSVSQSLIQSILLCLEMEKSEMFTQVWDFESQCESNLFRVSKDQNNLASQSNPASRWLFNFQNRHFYPPVEMLNFEFGSCSMIKWSKLSAEDFNKIERETAKSISWLWM